MLLRQTGCMTTGCSTWGMSEARSRCLDRIDTVLVQGSRVWSLWSKVRLKAFANKSRWLLDYFYVKPCRLLIMRCINNASLVAYWKNFTKIVENSCHVSPDADADVPEWKQMSGLGPVDHHGVLTFLQSRHSRIKSVHVFETGSFSNSSASCEILACSRSNIFHLACFSCFLFFFIGCEAIS